MLRKKSRKNGCKWSLAKCAAEHALVARKMEHVEVPTLVDAAPACRLRRQLIRAARSGCREGTEAGDKQHRWTGKQSEIERRSSVGQSDLFK